MPDLQNFSVVEAAAADVVVPSYIIEGQLADSNSGAVLADYTGENAIHFPQDLATMTVEQRNALLEQVFYNIVQIKAGYGG